VWSPKIPSFLSNTTSTVLRDHVNSGSKKSFARGCQRYKSCRVFTPEGLVFILSVVFECLRVLKFKISIFLKRKTGLASRVTSFFAELFNSFRYCKNKDEKTLQLLPLVFVLFFVCFLFWFFETGFLCVALAVLELTL
jgi:dolichol kinase